MTVYYWILFSGILMSAIALVGSVTLVLKEQTLRRILLPLVAFSAGSLIGGALFHMLPAAATEGIPLLTSVALLALGFLVFFALEQLLHWHHCHNADAQCRKPLTYLILLGDGLHNFLGGLAIAGTFLIDIRLGLVSWLAAAAHEIPQELGDFGVLVHGGWSRKKALLFNVLSASTFLLGGLVTYFFSFTYDLSWLIPFAAGNFLYIGASDLVPEVNKHAESSSNFISFAAFAAGLALLFGVKLMLG